jgi:hypothetical protein
MQNVIAAPVPVHMHPQGLAEHDEGVPQSNPKGFDGYD